MAEPLTAAEIEQIRDDDARDAGYVWSVTTRVEEPIARLLATVEAYRAIVQRVARGDLTTYRDREDEYCNGDPNCEWKVGTGQPSAFVHTSLCPVTRARALLGKAKE